MEQEQSRLLQNPGLEGFDKRKYMRVRASWRAQIRTAAGPVEARVVDVGEQGLGMLCDQAFPKGAVLDLVVGIPDLIDRSRAQPTGIQVEIVFSHFGGHRCRLGARFANPSPATSALIRWHVDTGTPV